MWPLEQSGSATPKARRLQRKEVPVSVLAPSVATPCQDKAE